MVGDDHRLIIQGLRNAERKSPPVYSLARDLFLRILQGDMSFDDARTQARRESDLTTRRCALEILDNSQRFLTTEPQSRVSRLPSLRYQLPSELSLDVKPLWVRQLDPERLLLLHFWEAPLSARQLRAAAAVIKAAIQLELPQFAACEIDFVSVPFCESRNSREFNRYTWGRLKPLNEEEMNRFWSQLLRAWQDYQKLGPRKLPRKETKDLFS